MCSQTNSCWEHLKGSLCFKMPFQLVYNLMSLEKLYSTEARKARPLKYGWSCMETGRVSMAN